MDSLQASIAHYGLKMGLEEFHFFQAKIFELAGISLSDAKLDLLQSRLRNHVLELKMNSYAEYQSYLSQIPPTDPEWEIFINLLTTNKTDWFREPEHFTFLEEEFLPKWKKLGKKHLSVWCAASSTGEEPYTLSMVLSHALKGSGITFSITASDIDTKVLGLAQNGVYRKSHLLQIPEKFHDFFSFGTEEISSWMKVKKEIKNHVTFKQINLIDSPFPWDSHFDLIMCRNVLIYFNPKTIEKVVEQLHRSAHPEGVLIIAHSESLQNMKTPWKYLCPSIYFKGKIF